MTEELFWKLIEESSCKENFNENIKRSLFSLGLEEIVSFKNILLKKSAQAYSFPLLAANFVISSYVSDDGFEVFRAWLVSNGSSKFFDAINNPETISSWLDKDEVEKIESDTFYYVADEAYIESGGADDFHDKLIYPPEPDIDMDWPENKAEFEKLYPALVTKFWNQKRIKELHSD